MSNSNSNRVTYRIHFEVNKLASGQRNDNLALVDCTFDDRFLVRCLPLVDSPVGANVTDAVWVDLHESVVAECGTAERGCRSQETAVRYFLDGVADAQYESGVNEGHDDVSIEFVCKDKKRNGF